MSSYTQLWWLQHLARPMLLLSDILCRRVAIVRIMQRAAMHPPTVVHPQTRGLPQTVCVLPAWPQLTSSE